MNKKGAFPGPSAGEPLLSILGDKRFVRKARCRSSSSLRWLLSAKGCAGITHPVVKTSAAVPVAAEDASVLAIANLKVGWLVPGRLATANPVGCHFQHRVERGCGGPKPLSSTPGIAEKCCRRLGTDELNFLSQKLPKPLC